MIKVREFHFSYLQNSNHLRIFSKFQKNFHHSYNFGNTFSNNSEYYFWEGNILKISSHEINNYAVHFAYVTIINLYENHSKSFIFYKNYATTDTPILSLHNKSNNFPCI